MIFTVSILFIVLGYTLALLRIWWNQRDKGKAAFYSICVTVISLVCLAVTIIGYIVFLYATFEGPLPSNAKAFAA
jgi:TctA family transporter